MKLNKNIKKSLCILAYVFLMMLLTGCGEKINIKVKDMYTETQLSIPVGKTVKEILKEAEININNNDKITPSLNKEITKDNTEIEISRYAKVQVDADNKIVTLELTGDKVKNALSQIGITLGKHDVINHEMEAYVTNGMNIAVTRRVEVSLIADGKIKKCLSEKGNVEEFLKNQKVRLGKDDRVSPKLSKELKEGMEVVVKRVDVKEITETEVIAYGTQTKQSNNMTVGTNKITRRGVNGKKKVTYKITYVDGEEESRKAIKEEIVKEPVDQIIVKGTKPKGKYIVSKEKVYDCDGSGHGYYIIKYSDGTVKYVDF